MSNLSAGLTWKRVFANVPNGSLSVMRMEKALIGNCPSCDARTEVALSRVFEMPVGVPRKCLHCGALLVVSRKRPEMVKVANLVCYLIFISIFWRSGQSVEVWCLAFLGFVLVSMYVNRTLGRPTLVVFSPGRDFLSEEMAADKSVSPVKPR